MHIGVDCVTTNEATSMACHDCGMEWIYLPSLMLHVPPIVPMQSLTRGTCHASLVMPLLSIYDLISSCEVMMCYVMSWSIDQCVLTRRDVISVNGRLQHMPYISILQLQASVERVLDQARHIRDYEAKHWLSPHINSNHDNNGTRSQQQHYMDDDDDFLYTGAAAGAGGGIQRNGLPPRDISVRDGLIHEALLRFDNTFKLATQLHADLPGETAITDIHDMLESIAKLLSNPDLGNISHCHCFIWQQYNTNNNLCRSCDMRYVNV
jgi:hypothetical protein